MISDGVLERLTVQIAADLDGLSRDGVRGIDTAMNSMERSVERGTGRMGKGFSVLGEAMKGFAIGAAASAAVAVVAFADKTLRAADDIGDLADRLGITAEAVQKLEIGFIQAGAAPGLMQTAMDKLNVGLGQFLQTGGGPAAEAFKTLGLSSQIASGQIKGTDQVFFAVTDALNKIEDPALRAATAMQTFGRASGPDMLEVTGNGSAALKGLGDAAQATGQVMSNEVVDKVGAAKLKLDSMKDSVGRVAVAMTGELIVATVGVVDAIEPLVAWFAQLDPAIVSAGVAATGLTAAFVVVPPAIAAIATAASAAAVMLTGTLIPAAIATAPVWVPIAAAIAAASAAVFVFVKYKPQIMAFAQACVEMGTTIVRSLRELPGKFLAIGKAVIDGLVQGIQNRLAALKSTIDSVGAQASKWFKDKMGIASPSKVFAGYGANLIEGLAEGIDGSAGEATSSLQSVMDRLNGVMVKSVGDTATEASEAFRALLADGTALFDRLATPAERLTSQMKADFTTLNELLDKQIITLAEYEKALGRIADEQVKTQMADMKPMAANPISLGRVDLPKLEGIPELVETASGSFVSAAEEIASALQMMSQRGKQSVGAMVANVTAALAKLAAAALPNMFGKDTKGGGILSGIAGIAKVFGGFFAKGGQLSGNKVGVVGEKGPELFAPGRTGNVIPLQKAGLSGGGGSNTTMVYLGNELVFAETRKMAVGAGAQSFMASRAQVPVDLMRANRHKTW